MSNTSSIETCLHCGMFYLGRCPQVRSIEYYPNGAIKKIEYENGQHDKPISLMSINHSEEG